MATQTSLKTDDITKDALEEYEKLVAITGFDSTFVAVDDNKSISHEKFEWGRHNGNLLISNASGARPEGKYGMRIAEYWMVFPDEIENSLKQAIFKPLSLHSATPQSHSVTDNKFINMQFSLYTFTELCITLEYRVANAEKVIRQVWENGKLNSAITEALKTTNFEGSVTIDYFITANTAKETA